MNQNEIARLRAVNAELVEALRDVDKFSQDNFDNMPVNWQTMDEIVQAALSKSKEVQP